MRKCEEELGGEEEYERIGGVRRDTEKNEKLRLQRGEEWEAAFSPAKKEEKKQEKENTQFYTAIFSRKNTETQTFKKTSI